MLSPKEAAQPNPSNPAPMSSDVTSPWSTDYGGNINSLNSDTYASNEIYLKEIKRNRKRHFYFKKERKMENKKKREMKKT